MDIKMIVTDLDGTLLRCDKTISDYTIDIMKRCRKQGIKIVFATARPTFMVKEFTEKFLPDAICANNGSCIFIGDNPPIKFLFEPDTQRLILRDLSRNNSFYRISAQTGEEYYSSDAGENHKADIDFTQDIDIKFCLIAFHYHNLDEALRILKKYKNINYHFVSGTDLVDIMPDSASKINSIKTVAAHFGIQSANIAAFGDDHNDVPILQNCGMGIAVANAINEAKAVADYICATNDNDGVAKWLDEYII